jgi:hypothetical protein
MSYSRRLDNVLQQIDYVENKINKDLINEFSKYLVLKDASANYQRNCIKIMLMFAEFIQEQKGRHSSITSDSDYLPEYALKKKVRWSMNSRQGISI